MMSLLLGWLGCWSGDVYIVEGTVVEVHAPGEVVLDHEEIKGLMGAMIMPFPVAEPSLLDGLEPGTRVVARYELGGQGGRLVDVRITGHGPPPALATGPVPVRVGETLAETRLTGHDGAPLVLGPEQTERVAVTFVYTRCPQPEFCPAMVSRLQALQQALGEADGVRIVAVTLDPAFDTVEVLKGYAGLTGAGPRWTFARADDLDALAMRAGLPVMKGEPEIMHGLRLLVLDRGGKLIERYDDARFPIDRVVGQLTTGGPSGDPANSGTVTPE